MEQVELHLIRTWGQRETEYLHTINFSSRPYINNKTSCLYGRVYWAGRVNHVEKSTSLIIYDHLILKRKKMKKAVIFPLCLKDSQPAAIYCESQPPHCVSSPDSHFTHCSGTLCRLIMALKWSCWSKPATQPECKFGDEEWMKMMKFQTQITQESTKNHRKSSICHQSVMWSLVGKLLRR